MDSTKQFFKQIINYFPDEKPLISLFNIICGLLMLAFLIIFLLVSIGYVVEFNQNQQQNQMPIIASTVITLQQVKKIRQDKEITNKIATIKITDKVAAVNNLVAKQLPIRDRLYQELLAEFQDDLPKWFAEIDRDSLTIRFQNPDFRFQVGFWSVNQSYKLILTDFFPRYVNVLEKYEYAIEALSIEGHTSSEWRSSSSKDEAYFSNMALSHDRTRAVLEFCLKLASVTAYKNWLFSILTANGLASSHLVVENGFENIEYSRRVEFRIRLLKNLF